MRSDEVVKTPRRPWPPRPVGQAAMVEHKYTHDSNAVSPSSLGHSQGEGAITHCLDCYDDRSLTEHELRRLRWEAAAGPAFQSFSVVCVNNDGQNLALKAGATYEVTGEYRDTWHFDETNDIPHLDFAKRRFVRIDEYPAWQVAQRSINSAVYTEGSRGDFIWNPKQQTREWRPADRCFVPFEAL